MNRTEARNILGVKLDYTKQTLLKRFRRLCVVHHPDVGGDVKIFKDVINAYELLNKQTFNVDTSQFKIKESTFQSTLMRQLQKEGALVFNMCGGGFQTSGIPDLYVAHMRWTGWLELKVKGKLSDPQKRVLSKLVHRRVPAFVMRKFHRLVACEWIDGEVFWEGELRLWSTLIEATDALSKKLGWSLYYSE